MGEGIALTVSWVIVINRIYMNYMDAVNHPAFREASRLHWLAFKELQKIDLSDIERRAWMAHWLSQCSSVMEDDEA